MGGVGPGRGMGGQWTLHTPAVDPFQYIHLSFNDASNPVSLPLPTLKRSTLFQVLRNATARLKADRERAEARCERCAIGFLTVSP